MVSKLGNVVIGHIAYTVSVKEDVQPEDSDDPDSEPFLFASIRGDDSKFFDANLVACVKKLLEDENIELTKSTVTSNCRFAFFFLTKWEDATKFVEKYDNKIINESPLHFEKGQPKSQRGTLDLVVLYLVNCLKGITFSLTKNKACLSYHTSS